MVWVLLTVIFFAVSSQADKQISAKLQCSPKEFAFLVSGATAVWMAVLFPFVGWHMEFTGFHMLLLFALTACKITEFYTSAILLKTVSAYELKAWLGINIILSYLFNIYAGKAQVKISALLFCLILFCGIAMILKAGGNRGKTIQLSLLFILSKFLYGLVLGMFSEGSSSISILFIVMIAVAVLQLPAVFPCRFLKKKGSVFAVLSRIPNTLGLLTEAHAAVQNIFLYAMVQPMQLLLLFVFSLIKKEPMPKGKLAGSILCIAAVCMITVVLFA